MTHSRQELFDFAFSHKVSPVSPDFRQCCKAWLKSCYVHASDSEIDHCLKLFVQQSVKKWRDVKSTKNLFFARNKSWLATPIALPSEPKPPQQDHPESSPPQQQQQELQQPLPLPEQQQPLPEQQQQPQLEQPPHLPHSPPS